MGGIGIKSASTSAGETVSPRSSEKPFISSSPREKVSSGYRVLDWQLRFLFQQYKTVPRPGRAGRWSQSPRGGEKQQTHARWGVPSSSWNPAVARTGAGWRTRGAVLGFQLPYPNSEVLEDTGGGGGRALADWGALPRPPVTVYFWGPRGLVPAPRPGFLLDPRLTRRLAWPCNLTAATLS